MIILIIGFADVVMMGVSPLNGLVFGGFMQCISISDFLMSVLINFKE